MLARTWNNKDFHSLLVRMKSGTTILEDTLAVSYKIVLLPYDPAIALLGIY